MGKVLEIFKPGEEIKRSGIYKVVHDNQHTESHEVTCVYGGYFPPCKHCGADVRFILVRAAQHVAAHERFK